MSRALNVLIVEDSEDDAFFLLHTLEHGGYEVTSEVVCTADAMHSALRSRSWDVITSDHAMPQFNARAALKLANEFCPDSSFIIVSGEIDLDLAVSLMQAGAKDYIQKRELIRILPVIERELVDMDLRRVRQQIETELIISETRYRRLFESAQDGILILDANTGLVTDVNPFLITMLDYSKEEFIGKQLWELGAIKDIAMSKQAFLELQNKGFVRFDNLPLQTKAGKHVAVEFVSNVYLVDHTSIAQCNIRDITDRVDALSEITKLNTDLEKRVIDRTAQLEYANKELEAFNYSVSHDLRAPLRRVMGFTEALTNDNSNNPSVESLRLINKIRFSIENMDALIEALLGLSRFSSFKLKEQSVNLSEVVKQITTELQQTNLDRLVEFEIPEGILVRGDRQLLQIVLENLIGNAWKFTSNRVETAIEFGKTQKEGVSAYFIKDNGAGFNMDYAEKLFNAFSRLHSEKEFPGIGIGLATVQRIIHRHGGRVWAEGDVDQGATFYFTLNPAC
jgi:PAS domain S-box-containing protein